jgi:eukaryotic-like serine/threonine-protein kinase
VSHPPLTGQADCRRASDLRAYVTRTSLALLEATQPKSTGEQPAFAEDRKSLIAGKYELVRQIGEGGMGTVWVARNVTLEVYVALKLIRADSGGPLAAERLLTEARAAARLRDEGIVRVFDYGTTASGDPFIVMELLTGQTLGDLLDGEQRIAATRAVQILLPLAHALAVAHAQGVIHRDLKPDNFILAESEGKLQPKIVDFGVAKLASADAHTRLTQGGVVLGSPGYLSPEQARGDDDIDQRADIWAFCIVLYECVTGRLPFDQMSHNALLRHIIEEPIPPITELAAGDDGLWAILERGLKKQRAERYASMRELGTALARWLAGHGISEDVCGQSVLATWLEEGSAASERSHSTATTERRRLPANELLRTTIREIDPPASGPASATAATAPKRRAGLVLAIVAVTAVFAALAGAHLLSRSGAERDPEPKPALATPDAVRVSGNAEPSRSASAPVETAKPAHLASSEPKQKAPPSAAGARQRPKKKAADASAGGAPPDRQPPAKPGGHDFGF